MLERQDGKDKGKRIRILMSWEDIIMKVRITDG